MKTKKIGSQKKIRKTKAGFSLVEVLISLLVLVAGITAIITLMTGNIKNANNNKNQIIASELAQEGVELFRNLKDNGAVPYLVIDGNYQLDAKSNALVLFSDGRLYLNAKNLFQHSASGNTETKFYRKIKISNIINGANKFINVTSFVHWREDGLFPAPEADCKASNSCVQTTAVLLNE